MEYQSFTNDDEGALKAGNSFPLHRADGRGRASHLILHAAERAEKFSYRPREGDSVLGTCGLFRRRLHASHTLFEVHSWDCKQNDPI